MNSFDYYTKHKTNKKPKYIEEFNSYLQNILLEPNALTNEKIIDLGEECLLWTNLEYNQFKRINVGITYRAISFINNNFRHIWEQLTSIINEYTQNENNIYPWDIKDFEINPVRDLGVIFPFRDLNKIYHSCACGALNMRFYKLIYYFDFLGVKIKNPYLKRFWKFYKKTLNVYAISLQQYSWGCQIYIIPKFDKIHIKNRVTHYKYNYTYYCDGIEVPQWLYEFDKKDATLDYLTKIENVDYRSIVIKKMGLENFLNLADVVDTYENYPENDWWAKSEYKLVNMKNMIAKMVEKEANGKLRQIYYYDYAPFL